MARRIRLVVAAMACVAAIAGPAMADPPGRLTKPVQVTKDDLDPSRTYGAPTLVVDPADPLTVVAGFADLRTRRCGLRRSTDGGQTWKLLDASPSPASYQFCLVPSQKVPQTLLAFGRNHTLYYALFGWDVQDGGTRQRTSIFLARSTDLGDSWQTSVVRDARPLEKEANRPLGALAIDTKSGSEDVIYLSWDRYGVFGGAVGPVSTGLMAVSTDGGRTFSDPIDVTGGYFNAPEARAEALGSAPAPAPGSPPVTTAPGTPERPPADLASNFGSSDPRVAVDGKGTVFVSWTPSTSSIAPPPQSAIYLSRSTDKGRTFTVSQVAPYSAQFDQSFSTPRLLWGPEGGPDGTLHLVYQANTRPAIVGTADVFYRHSTDGGKTWSEQRALNDDDPEDLRGHYMPNISRAPNGRLDVVWWDTRDDPGLRMNDVYHTFSTDNGATWAKNDRVTDRSIDRRIGVFGNGYDVSSPPGIASTNAYTIIGWDDTRNTDASLGLNQERGAGLQDIYTAAVQYQVIGGGSSRAAKIVLAGVVGILAVGLMLLLAGFVSRRSTGVDPDSSTRDGRRQATVH